MVKKIQKANSYIPDQQDLIWLDFDPSVGHEIRKRRPAVVLSNQGYSQLTGLVLVCPITPAPNNALKNSGLLIPISDAEIDGFINPLQLFTYNFKQRHATHIGMLPTPSFIEIRRTISNILN